MHEQGLWFHRSLIPMITGFLWLYVGVQHGAWWLWTGLPGALMLVTGSGLLLFSGDRRVQQFMALGAVISVPWALVLVAGPGWQWAAVLVLLSAFCFTTSGRASLTFEPFSRAVPQPEPDEKLSAFVALDNAIIGYFVMAAEIPDAEKCRRMRDESELLISLHQQHGWLQNLDDLHPAPQPLADLHLKQARVRAGEYHHLTFTSPYEASEELPGAKRWMGHRSNRKGHAWVWRHAEPAPWLLCIHGYRMGTTTLDFSLFDPNWLHHKLGFNLLMPTLPLHGLRRIGFLSGSGYIDGEVSDILHAEIQAMQDIRSLLHWVRNEPGGEHVGALGYSLGGYNAALLACLEDDLECVIAGIPLADIPAALWRHMPLQQRRYLQSIDLDQRRLQAALQAVSPLSLKPRVPRTRLSILAATADQIVPPTQAVRLREHWGVPEIAWYPGSHMSVRREPRARQALKRALVESGLLDAESGQVCLPA